MATERVVNFEVLRVVSMVFIVMLHLYIDNGIMESSLPAADGIAVFNYIVSEIINSVLYISVNCYVLITGYFMAGRCSLDIEKIEKIWFFTFFYMFGLTLIFFLTGKYDTQISDVIDSALVIRGDRNWFVKCYIGLLAVSPFLSILIKNINRKQYNLLLIVLTLLNVNIIKPLNFPYGDIYDSYGGVTFSWFVYLYMIAGYIRIYDPMKDVSRCVRWFLFFWLMLALELFVKIVADYRSTGCLVFNNIGSLNGIFFPMSLFFFLYFKNAKFTSVRWKLFTLVSPYMFGVFLLHEHFKLRLLIWEVLNPKEHVTSLLFMPYIVLCVAVIFIIGVFVDWLRASFVKKCGLTNILPLLNGSIYGFFKRFWR